MTLASYGAGSMCYGAGSMCYGATSNETGR